MFWGGIMLGQHLSLIPVQCKMSGLVYRNNIPEPTIGLFATVNEGFILMDNNICTH